MQEPRYIKIAELEELTAISRKTIKKRLDSSDIEKVSDGYLAAEALAWIYSFETSSLKLDRLTKNQAATLTGTSISTITRTMAAHGIVQDEEGLLPAREILNVILAKSAFANAAATDDDMNDDEDEDGEDVNTGTNAKEPTILDYKREIERVKLEKATIDLDALKGKYIDVEELKKEWGEVLRSMRARFLALPNRFAQAFTGTEKPEDVRYRLAQELEQILNETARLGTGHPGT
jgi:hypothetical protein